MATSRAYFLGETGDDSSIDGLIELMRTGALNDQRLAARAVGNIAQ